MRIFNQDNNKVIHNNQMGWVIHAYVDDSIRDYNEVDDTYNMCDNVALLYMWNKLEPEEGKFDFTLLDKAIEKYSKMGKNLHFRISTDPMIYEGSNGVPEWVFEKYHVKYQTKEDYGCVMKFPDYLDPVYLEKMSNFLKALAKRYGKLNNLLQIDLRGYGEWGEWHSGYMHKDIETHHKALEGIIKVWVDAFKDTNIPLAISSSYEWRADLPLKLHAPSSLAEYKYFQAFDYALSFDNVTFRRDGIGGAVKGYDMEIMQEYYQNGTRPMTGEYFVAYLKSKETSDGIRGYHIEDAIEEALQLHPNYMMLPWDSVAFYNQRQDLVEYGLKKMGFRLLPEVIEVDNINKDSYIAIKQRWINNACGKLCGKSTLVVKLVDENGNFTIEEDETFEAIKILQNKNYEHISTISTKNLEGEVYIYMGIKDYRNEFINLPLDDKEDNLYRVGKLFIK